MDEILLHERFLPWPGYEGLYELSNRGRVRSLSRVVRDKHGQPRTLAERFMILWHDFVWLSKNGVQRRYAVPPLVRQLFPEG